MSKPPSRKIGSEKKSANALPTTQLPRTPWYAVSIVAGGQACAIARRLLSNRWLSAAAPRFPLAGCDAKRCDCRYRHHADRRAALRRQLDREGRSLYFKGTDNRSPRLGRRKSDG